MWSGRSFGTPVTLHSALKSEAWPSVVNLRADTGVRRRWPPFRAHCRKALRWRPSRKDGMKGSVGIGCWRRQRWDDPANQNADDRRCPDPLTGASPLSEVAERATLLPAHARVATRRGCAIAAPRTSDDRIYP